MEILSQQLSSVDKASPTSSIKGDVDLIKPVDISKSSDPMNENQAVVVQKVD